MADEIIKVSDYWLAKSIQTKLVESNKRNGKFSINDCENFMLSELREVEDLVLDGGCRDISDIKYLINLKRLIIKSRQSVSVAEILAASKGSTVKPLINEIDDFSPVQGLSNLEYLSIENASNIENLDVSQMKNLTKLKLIENPRLTVIEGLEAIKHLTSLTLDGTNIKTNLDIIRLIKRGVAEIQLDMTLFNSVIRYNPNIVEEITRCSNKGVKVYWSERLGMAEYNFLTTEQMLELHNVSNQIIARIINKEDFPVVKVTSTYLYIVQNISYDHEGREFRWYYEMDPSRSFSEEEDYRDKMINSSYNAIVKNKCICEGYTNAMRFLLFKLKIPSVKVRALKKQYMDFGYSIEELDHSIIRVMIEGEWYYFDPTWDAGKKEVEFFFKTKEEIEQTHVLSISEREVETPAKKTFSCEELVNHINSVTKNEKELAVAKLL